MTVMRSFLRRLLVQAIVSSTVMAGIQVAVRFGPEFLPSQRVIAEVGPSGPSGTQEALSRPIATTEPPSSRSFALDRTDADVKAGRFPVWRQREAPVPVLPPERLASKGKSNGLSDVMLFDRCQPGCESRDPLLAFNKPRAAVPPAPVQRMADPVMEVTAPIVNGPSEIEDDDSAPSQAGFVSIATRGGLSMARRIVGTAGNVVGW